MKDVIGFSGSYQAQVGNKHVSAKPLKGYGGAGVVEIVENHDTNTYRCGLHDKIQGRGLRVGRVSGRNRRRALRTPQADIERINKRLEAAHDHYKQSSRGE